MRYILLTISSILISISALLSQLYPALPKKNTDIKLGAITIPLNTVFRFGMRHRYDYITCNGDYACNKQAFQNNLITHPQVFPIWEEIPSETLRGFEIIIWEEIATTTLTDAIVKLKTDIVYRAKKVQAKDINGIYQTLYDFGTEK